MDKCGAGVHAAGAGWRLHNRTVPDLRSGRGSAQLLMHQHLLRQPAACPIPHAGAVPDRSPLYLARSRWPDLAVDSAQSGGYGPAAAASNLRLVKTN